MGDRNTMFAWTFSLVVGSIIMTMTDDHTLFNIDIIKAKDEIL
ncbi:hypothetical protein [Paenibacillus anseongense]|nr:hypothetical protein [Paenibacillus anseongense]